MSLNHKEYVYLLLPKLTYLVLLLVALVCILALVTHENPSTHMHEWHPIVLYWYTTLARVGPIVYSTFFYIGDVGCG